MSAFDFDIEFSPAGDCLDDIGKKWYLLAGVFFRLKIANVEIALDLSASNDVVLGASAFVYARLGMEEDA